LRLQIPEDMNKLLVDITLSFLDKGGYRGREAERVAAIVKKAEHKEYGGIARSLSGFALSNKKNAKKLRF